MGEQIVLKNHYIKNTQIDDSFRLNTKEGVYCLEFEKPLSLKMSEDEQIHHIFAHCVVADCNEQMAKIVGYQPNKGVFGIKLNTFFRPSEAQNVEAVKMIVRSGYQDAEFESREYDAHGNVLFFLNWVSADVEDDVVVRVWARLQDISERRRAETELGKALSEIRELKNQLEAETVYLKEDVKSIQRFDEIVGKSDGLKAVFEKTALVAPTNSTVLILGETGTGKELIAHKIHELSGRRMGALVKVNCAALSGTLLESELFGHEKGAFSGADRLRIGRFELANGGTIFLDEIGEIPLSLQAKLLRVLQSGEFERIGSSYTQKVDVRIVSATNQNLEKMIQEGLFREDLYFRLSVYPILIPPLRRRREDIPLLVDAFVKNCTKQMGKTITQIPAHTMEILVNYHWPGNVRELQNVIERAVITSSGPSLKLIDTLKNTSEAYNRDEPESLTLEDVERNHILHVLRQCEWKVEGGKGASGILGLPPSTLRNRMRRLNISRPV